MQTSLADAQTSDLWAAALERLEPRYNKPVFEMWLKPMRLVELTPNEIVLAVNTTFARDWVENRLKNDITGVLHDILGAEIALRVVVDAGPGTETRRDRGSGPAAGDGRRTAGRKPQPALHLRRLRRREFEPLRPRRLAGRGRGAGDGLQPALSLRRRRSGQDPLDARDRPPRPGAQSQRQHRVRLEREVHQRIHHRDQEQSDRRVSQPLSPRRRAADRRHPVSRRQRANPRGVLSHLQLAARSAEAARHLERSPAQRDSNARVAPALAVRMGSAHRHPAAGFRDARSDLAQEGRDRARSRFPTTCWRSSPKSFPPTSANSKAR